jgi:hypothetical protein
MARTVARNARDPLPAPVLSGGEAGIMPSAAPEPAPKKRGRKPREKTYSILPDAVADAPPPDNENIVLHLVVDFDAVAAPARHAFEDQKTKPGEQPGFLHGGFCALEYSPVLHDPAPFEPDLLLAHHCGASPAPMLTAGSYIDAPGACARPGKFKDRRTNRVVHDLLRFVDGSDFPVATSVKCWWCCEQFAGPPCGIPVKLVGVKFHVHGLFCTYNCACAYLFNEADLRDRAWSLLPLLNLAHKRSVVVTPAEEGAADAPQDSPLRAVRMAPPRQTLKSFGGYMGVEEFRRANELPKSYKLILPPMTLIIPQIEEVPQHVGAIPVNKQRMYFATQALKIQEASEIDNNAKQSLGNYMTIRKMPVKSIAA